MQAANTILSQWGPALLICCTVVLGFFYQNGRMNDLGRRIDDLKGSIDKRFDDLKDYIRSEFKRVDERIDRLESPLARK